MSGSARLGVFRKTGWDLIPYPVDYQVLDVAPFTSRAGLAANLVRIGAVLKEWVGLVVYYLVDRTCELFPGPDAPRQTDEP